MKSRVLISVLTIAVFAAGYGARAWMDHQRCVVPPPPALLGELSQQKDLTQKVSPDPVPNPAKLAAQLERLRPEMEKFRARMQELDDELDRAILAVLRPDQMPLWDKVLKRRVEYTQSEEAGIRGDSLLTSDQIASLQQRPLYKLLAIVVVPQRLDWFAHDLNLDDAQRAKVGEALLLRREKFLALVDSSPPPSLALSRLAPLAQRLGQPAKPSDPKK
jgi:hypothetical protein